MYPVRAENVVQVAPSWHSGNDAHEAPGRRLGRPLGGCWFSLWWDDVRCNAPTRRGLGALDLSYEEDPAEQLVVERSMPCWDRIHVAVTCFFL
jgi:hypothetical protein